MRVTEIMKKRPEREDVKPPEPVLAEARIQVTAQLIAMRAGLYALELAPIATTRAKGGMLLPCARIDPLPDSEAETHVAWLTASPLLLPGSYPAFVRVGGEASLLLTIYKLAGPSAAPELRIRYMGALAGGVPEPVDTQDSLPLSLSVHAERYGDITVSGGAWAAAPGAASAIEGFAVQLEGDLPGDALEYQAILGRDWASPWTAGGDYCGSRGLALPLVGVRMRLKGNYAESHRMLVWARFSQAGEKGPFEDEAAFATVDDVLVGLRVALIEKTTPTEKPPPAKTAKRVRKSG